MSYRKDPSAVLDYAFDWANPLPGDDEGWLAASETITTRTVTVETGLTKNSDTSAAGVVTVWLSGGTDGEDYKVACRIVTNQGRTDERTIRVAVRDR